MKAVTDKLSGIFNLRVLVAVIGLSLVLFPEPPYLGWLDRQLFALGTSLHAAPAPSLAVAMVELPEEEVEFLISDPGRAEKTLRLLKRITSSPKVTVGLLLPEPLGRLPEGLEQLLWDGEGFSASVYSAADEDGELRSYLEVSRDFLAFHQHPRLVQSAALPEVGAIGIQTAAGSDSFSFLLPSLPTTAPVMEHAPALLYRNAGEVQGSFFLELYARIAAAEEVIWHQHRAIQVGGSLFPLSADARFVPYPHSDRGVLFSLEQALAQRLPSNLILLGAADSPVLAYAANALRSLDAETYYRSPSWFVVTQALLIAAIAFYLLLVLPRLSYSTGILASSLLLVILMVSQLGAQITQWLWLPMGLPMQFLLLGHILVRVWKHHKGKVLQLQAAAHGARYQLGLQLFRDGRSDDALLAIKECFSSEAVLSLMYDIAAQQERKRLYNEAIKTYQSIVKRQPGFRDAEQKVEKLMAFSSGTLNTLGSNSEIAKTLIISESSISKPVLGRYEVERELGRGAMGVVYLGRDPKISRQVAIKTLSYGQLDPRELEEFKQRFFREAEAAGRLSHPNIVTIYDVGEEHDLAFIAMDYVQGEPLSVYATESNLLPVDTVLRVIAEVADALEYAHSKQIIHRDIKPANIIYEPSTELVKVTDFGVARIVDSAKTNTGDILGSPLYMAPEQLKAGKVQPATDVYSLGVTLYQLLSGKLPFEGENLASLTYNIIHKKPPNIRELRSDLPSGITRIINRALHKDAERRYASAAAMGEALRKLLAEL